MRDDGGTEEGAEEGDDEGGDGGDLSLLTLLSCLSWGLAQGLSALCLYALNCLNTLITFPPPHLPPSGILYVNKSLDFETNPKYFLSIECSRKGSSSLGDMTTIVVNITDINEHRPRFPQDLYSARVLENAIVGDTVLTVRIYNFAVWGT